MDANGTFLMWMALIGLTDPILHRTIYEALADQKLARHKRLVNYPCSN